MIRISLGPAAPYEERWHPVSTEPDVIDGSEIGDDNWAGGSAYGVTFAMPAAPGSVLTIWTYVAYGIDSGRGRRETSFTIAYAAEGRYDASPAGSPAAFTRRNFDPHWHQPISRADQAAREHALALVAEDADTMSEMLLCGLFEWGG